MRQEDIALKVGGAGRQSPTRCGFGSASAGAGLARSGLLSVGHAKVVLALKAPEEQLLAAETVLRPMPPCVLRAACCPFAWSRPFAVEVPPRRE